MKRSLRRPVDEPRQLPLSSINTTPLVDVMLVLLIVFLITVPLVRQAGRVDLPRAAAPPAARGAAAQWITVRRDGRIEWAGDALGEPGQLQRRLRNLARLQRHPRVLIAADRSVPYAAVARVVQACDRAGITRVGFLTRPPGR